MCGIAGLAGGDIGMQMQAAKRMAAALRYRGPDDEGIWQDMDAGVTLVFRRLAIIDLSPEGAQPMVSESGRYTIVFNGEIYNFQDLRTELELLKARFHGRSDTEVLLAACEQWGINAALQKINGMFAFALHDKQTRQIHFARDRIGKKPLYVGWAGKQLLFASELKAFHAHGGFQGEIDRSALALYLKYACVQAPFSIYKGVWQMLPGCRLTVDLGRLEPGTDLAKAMQPYWSLPHIVEESRQKPITGDDTATAGEFEDLLRGCVRDRMVSDVPLGAFLSGGIDSSAVVALMQQVSAKPVKTYTIGFHEQGFDEASHAAAVARHLGTDHHELYLSARDALDIVPRLPEIYDEPFADASQIPTFLVSRFAREEVTVALTGDGGDEMLGGYLRHVMVPGLWGKVKWMPRPLRARVGHAIRSWPQEKWDAFAPHHPQFGRRLYKFSELMALKDGRDLYTAQVEHWRDPPVAGGADLPLIPLADAAWMPRGLNFTEAMIYLDTLSYLPNDLMVKTDRASMAASLEARAPLLDRRIAEYAWRLPMRFKIRGGQGKWLLRQILSRHMPGNLFDRPKQGFSVPVGQWLRGPLKDWAGDLLSPAALTQAGYLDTGVIGASWAAYQAGDLSQTNCLWNALMFQAWHARWHGANRAAVAAA